MLERVWSWWECKLIQPLWKTVRRLLLKLGIKPPYDPEIPLLGTKTEETDFEKNWFTLRKPKLKKNTCIPLFTAALFTIARTWKQSRCPSTVKKGFLFSASSPAFIVCRFFDDGHSEQCEVISHCSFDLHFSNNE